MSGAVASAQSGWRARLRLGFAHQGCRTVLQRRSHEGPLCVQRPFYPEGEVCHTYILHPPAGMVGGDSLDTRVDVGAGASALITTPASAKVYRSLGPSASVGQRLAVAAGGTLEWLPQDTILFGGSRASMETDIRLEQGARFIGWEVLSLGRPRSGDDYRAGAWRQRTRLFVDGEPQLIDRQAWQAGDAQLQAPWGLGGNRVAATFLLYPANAETLTRTREWILAAQRLRMAATLLADVLVVRALGNDAAAMRDALAELWSALREGALGRVGCAPRIWAT